MDKVRSIIENSATFGGDEGKVNICRNVTSCKDNLRGGPTGIYGIWRGDTSYRKGSARI